MENNTIFKYFAFISYSSRDIEWGKRLQRKLEHYRMPATLCREYGWKRTPINPVFFAPTDIQPGGLSEELQDRLRVSKNLIVICSPNSTQSEWVGKEIEFFHHLGRTRQIHFFIVDGTPHSGNPDTECFNPIVNTLGLPEILGANIHEKIYRWHWLNKERAYVQIISKLLGLEFDAIWQRHKRLLIQKAICWAVGIISVIASLICVWVANQPVSIEVRLNEVSAHNANLPPLKDAVVTLKLDNETKTDTIRSLDASTVFTNIPHRYLNKEINAKLTCRDFMDLDTTVTLTQDVLLNIKRNPAVYGDIHFKLWKWTTEQTSQNTVIIVAGHRTISDADGVVTLSIPLEEQDTVYSVSSSAIQLVDRCVYPPFGPDDIVRFK